MQQVRQIRSLDQIAQQQCATASKEYLIKMALLICHSNAKITLMGAGGLLGSMLEQGEDRKEFQFISRQRISCL